MESVDSIVLDVLEKLPSEAPNLDYKEMPYNLKKLDVIKDVIAMLNAESAMADEKLIVFGVSDNKERKGIDKSLWHDDNEFQNCFDKIEPRPIDIRTGTVIYENKVFGYIYISPLNNEWIYEVGERITLPKIPESEKVVFYSGQAFTRQGSKNVILFSKNRQRILEKKLQFNSSNTNIIFKTDDDGFLAKFALLGECNENCAGDISALTLMTGVSKTVAIETLRKMHRENPTEILYNAGLWRMAHHFEMLTENADLLYDNHIDSFIRIAGKAFRERDAKYDLPSNKRYASEILNMGKRREYSTALCKGLAESMAILGNNADLFCNVTYNKIINELCSFERGFFSTNDWRAYASTAEWIPLFGEACPQLFLSEIERLARSNDSAFSQFLSEREQGIVEIGYGHQLSWVIANIAKDENYFSKAVSVLLQLARIKETFLDTIVGIVVPWFPQTNAPLSVRVGVFRGLIIEEDNLTWTVLMKLMPGVTTTSSPVIKPLFLKVPEPPESVTQKEYYEASLEYIGIALEMLNANVSRICDIIPVMDDVSVEIQEQILAKIQDACQALEIHEKEIVWNKLKDFTLRHRKFRDAKWSLDEERLYAVDKMADYILPDAEHAILLRLFRKDQHFLFEHTGQYLEEQNRIRNLQIHYLENVFREDGIDYLISLVKDIENSWVFGNCLSEILVDSDLLIVINSFIDSNEDLINGIVRGLKFDRVNHIALSCSDEIKVALYSKCYLSKDCFNMVSQLSEEMQRSFWQRTDVNGVEMSDIDFVCNVVRCLNDVDRTGKSITVLYSAIKGELLELPTKVVVDTLDKDLKVVDSNTLDEYYLQNLIQWLQEKKVSKESLLAIEWKYLVVLDEMEGYPPKTLWNELAINPEFFMDILCIVGGKEERDNDSETNELKVGHCYKLLFDWKKTPGTTEKGDFDEDILDKWISYVSEKSKELEIESLAFCYFGQTAFHAPKDSDGFFINHKVAGYLQDDKTGHMLSGYRTEAINSRGVYTVDPTGETEFRIEKEYLEKANEADARGFFRLANTLRDIARDYHEEGKRNQS